MIILEFEGETPTKTFNGLKDLLTLTPETDEETTKTEKKTPSIVATLDRDKFR